MKLKCYVISLNHQAARQASMSEQLEMPASCWLYVFGLGWLASLSILGVMHSVRVSLFSPVRTVAAVALI